MHVNITSMIPYKDELFAMMPIYGIISVSETKIERGRSVFAESKV